ECGEPEVPVRRLGDVADRPLRQSLFGRPGAVTEMEVWRVRADRSAVEGQQREGEPDPHTPHAAQAYPTVAMRDRAGPCVSPQSIRRAPYARIRAVAAIPEARSAPYAPPRTFARTSGRSR